MSAVAERSEELNTFQSDKASSMALILDSKSMESAMKIAEVMATSKVTVPKHLQGQTGDCMAIVLQSMNWGMNPFVVAQKTHIVNGALGYEAQLVNAVVQSQGFINGTFTYEYQGDGASLKCRVGAKLKGSKQITWGEWLALSEITTKNSPLWKTNPKQQIGYLQVKNWTRAYCPGAILGVYSTDELEAIKPEKDVTPDQPEVIYLDDENFNGIKNKHRETVVSGKKSAEDLINWVESKGVLMTNDQKTEVNGWVKPKPTVVEGEAQEVDDDFTSEYNKAEGGE